jgi:hypothetical protein
LIIIILIIIILIIIILIIALTSPFNPIINLCFYLPISQYWDHSSCSSAGRRCHTTRAHIAHTGWCSQLAHRTSSLPRGISLLEERK